MLMPGRRLGGHGPLPAYSEPSDCAGMPTPPSSCERASNLPSRARQVQALGLLHPRGSLAWPVPVALGRVRLLQPKRRAVGDTMALLHEHEHSHHKAPDNGDSYDQRPGRLHRPESLAQTPVSASLAPTTGGVQPASWADWWCALSGAQRAYPSKPCTTASRRGRRDPTTATRRGQRSVYAGSANTRSVRPTRALGAFSGSSRARSPCPARWRPPPRHRSHHPDSYGHPPSANIHHRHGSNNPSRLVPRLSPTQAFRSRLPRRAEPRPVTAAEALLLVLRRAYRHVPTAASVPEPARVARSE